MEPRTQKSKVDSVQQHLQYSHRKRGQSQRATCKFGQRLVAKWQAKDEKERPGLRDNLTHNEAEVRIRDPSQSPYARKAEQSQAKRI
jgi:hypothetical protein